MQISIVSLAEKSQFRSSNKKQEDDTDSEDYSEEESSYNVEMSEENPTVTTEPNPFDATKLLSCFMKDFDFGSNYEEFLPNLRYEKCYLACKQKTG